MKFSSWQRIKDQFKSLKLKAKNFFKPIQLNSSSLKISPMKANYSNYDIELAVPGLNKRDLNIEIEGNMMRVSSEKRHENEWDEFNFHRKESYYTSFCKYFSLPEGADHDKIKANIENGMLKISVPYKNEKVKQIKVA